MSTSPPLARTLALAPDNKSVQLSLDRLRQP